MNPSMTVAAGMTTAEARTRLYNKGVNGKPQPLCLNCGDKATNDLPTCNKPHCIRAVRPIHRWVSRVAELVVQS